MRLSLKLICIKFNVPICWKHNNCHLHGVHVCIAAPVPMVEFFFVHFSMKVLEASVCSPAQLTMTAVEINSVAQMAVE